MSLVSILIRHHTSIIKETTAKLRTLEQEKKSKITLQEEQEAWTKKSKEIVTEVNKLSEELRQTRENKLQPGRQTNKPHSSKEAPPHEVETLLRQFLTNQENTHRPPRGAWKQPPRGTYKPNRGRGRGRGEREKKSQTNS